MEKGACLSVLLAKLTWYKTLILRHDQQIESQRRLRLKKLKEARRIRLRNLLKVQRHRAAERRRSRLCRLYTHQKWMKTMAHRFFIDNVRTPTVWFYPRTSDWWENVATKYTDDEWISDFRVSKKTFSYLCRKLKPELERQDTSYRLCIPLPKRVAVALYKLATPCEYGTVGNLFAVSITSVCRCVREFCSAVITVLLPELICTPDQAKLSEMADQFEQQYGIPQCVGIIDSCHIPVLRPSQHRPSCHNTKDYNSIILQAAIDGKGMFWDVNIGFPGNIHEDILLRSSSLWRWAVDGNVFTARTKNICGADVGYFVLGDSAYTSKTWLLTPFPDAGCLTPQQELYNIQTSQAHSVAERSFKRLKGRWKCLCKRNDCSVEVVKDMVQTCCVLHNLCQRNQDIFLPEWDTDDQPKALRSVVSETGDSDAANVRLVFQQYFVNNVQIKRCIPPSDGSE